FDRPEGSRLIRKLTENLLQHREEWQIADVRSLTSPLGTTPRAHEALAGLPFSAKLLQPIVHQRSLEYYVSHAGDLQGHVTRLDLVLRVDPLSRHGLEALDRLVEVLPGQLPPGLSTGTDLAFRGSTVSLRDLAAVTRSDQWHLQILTPAAVLVILLFLVRRLVSSLYLVLSVLVSYLATLGATFLIFEWWYGAEFPGIDWTVPLFLLTLLVAVGEDYNIFLVARIREEQEQHGPIGGIPAGLARTGRIISGCGFIMAGTFGSLAAASVVSMKELGFALAFGVLLDTLLVRPILVPSFLILLEKARGRLLGRSTASVEQADSVYGRSQA
ncbi:MAG: MMPL family transporter, partial [Planctomycetes bacterium]|nr:MMPL family transporter [Planctomycetota bacterium]